MLYPVLLCAFSGLATALGGLIVVWSGGVDNKKMSVSQGFAAGVMIAVSAFDLLPESYEGYITYMPSAVAVKAVLSLFMTGGLIGALLGGVVLPKTEKNTTRPKSIARRTAVVTTAVMVLHNLPEGVLTMFTSSQDLAFGARMAMAVALHNIPEGLAIASPLYYVTGNKKNTFMVTLWAGMAELAGGVLAYILLQDFITPAFLNGLMPIIAGIMCRAAVTELIPAGVKLSHFKHTFCGIIYGITLITIGLFMF